MLIRLPVIVCALIFISSSVFAYTIEEVGNYDDNLISAWLNNSGDAAELEAFADYASDGAININGDKDTSDMSLWKDDDASSWQKVFDGNSEWIEGVWAYQFDLNIDPDQYIIKTAGIFQEMGGEYLEVNTLLYDNLESRSFAVIDLSQFYIYKNKDGYLPIDFADEGEPPKLSHISAPVPEPSTLLLLGSGLLGLAVYRRKKS